MHVFLIALAISGFSAPVWGFTVPVSPFVRPTWKALARSFNVDGPSPATWK